MCSRADAVLAAIPVLAMSGLVLRTAVTATGFGTSLLAAPLTPVGLLAAFGLILRELFFGPVAEKTAD
ncbi:hypothetical protein OB955_03120 [Halobacteria archaeon AArc-m2/3/4]|uniref:Uncharacterized protein n=1 Tax=Natronoglomus mannanivorans TaxID=2979990 RepID=A0AAP2YVB5_9EURY|nr:hypothetical protein [Halobacteria archaeon AArc-xg1-1]MCU4971728.1 hypothetical protein [Halobacteria archaeon AArc-m2/3/4]